MTHILSARELLDFSLPLMKSVAADSLAHKSLKERTENPCLLFVKSFLSITLAFGTLFFYTDNARGCSVVSVSQVDPAIEVVQGSAVIVRAQAVGYVAEPEGRQVSFASTFLRCSGANLFPS